jgi:manganese transport protein
MGVFAIPRGVAWLAWIVAAIILVLNFKLLYDTIYGIG